MDPRIQAYLAAIRAQLGNPYTWPCDENRHSGKGYETALYPWGRDCSGTFAVGIRSVDPTVRCPKCSADWREHRCQMLWEHLESTDSPEAGDLCLYGTEEHVSHVMTLEEDGRVIGACGGGTTTVHPKEGACVQYRPTVNYRIAKDLLGYRRNPLRKEKKP